MDSRGSDRAAALVAPRVMARKLDRADRMRDIRGMVESSARGPGGDFSHVRAWVFDLDNTLYPPSSDVFAQVDGRITLWLAHYYGLDGLSARALQKHWYQRYGTSLNGLMIEEGIEDPHDFLQFVHDIDHSELHPDPRLARAIERLPGRKFILTNGSRGHAEKVARRLAIAHAFEDIFDIAAARFTPKPRPETYQRFLDMHAVDPLEAAMFEDLAQNLEVPRLLGMRTVLVVGARPPGKDSLADWESADLPCASGHVDHVTSDLAGFLECVGGGQSRTGPSAIGNR